ncbi:MAG: HAD family hydrolase [Anaerolineales bacterium]|nr:HAD family hydrolase [Anaerolineales bacterium]MCS7247318.1 HAD family hydrolase [Anaerolineales bacterium]MDW8161129.1 HAD family hydrolase [Anaerolineales bacterium]MDW8446671.1 HAD family hydrolase [Anaerolineales bacterium]
MEFGCLPSPLRRTVIFDFDGVLTDTLPEMLRFSDQVCAELGYQLTTTPEDIRGLSHMSFDQLARRLGIAEALVPQYVQKILQRFEESPITFSPIKGMEEVIRELSADSVLAIVSGNLRQVIRRFLEKYHLAQYFWRIEGIDQIGSKQEKILKIRQQIPLSLPTFMVGDAASDVLAAKEAGAVSVAVAWGHQDLEKLRQAQPDFLVENPQELIRLLRSNTSPFSK